VEIIQAVKLVFAYERRIADTGRSLVRDVPFSISRPVPAQELYCSLYRLIESHLLCEGE